MLIGCHKPRTLWRPHVSDGTAYARPYDRELLSILYDRRVARKRGDSGPAGFARGQGITILVWVVVILLFFWVIGHFITAVLLFVIAALLAYALVPGVILLQRGMPRPLAVAMVYLLALAVIGGLGYFLVSTTINQLVSFALNIPNLLKPSTPGYPSPIARLLGPLGIRDAQINAARQQMLTWLESSAGQIVNSAVPIIASVAAGIVDAIIVFILSIYLTADGPRLYRWLSTAPPRKVHTCLVFLLNTLRRTVGGYIRGQLFMSAFIGILVGGGRAAFQVPYAALLGIMAFIWNLSPYRHHCLRSRLCRGCLCHQVIDHRRAGPGVLHHRSHPRRGGRRPARHGPCAGFASVCCYPGAGRRK